MEVLAWFFSLQVVLVLVSLPLAVCARVWRKHRGARATFIGLIALAWIVSFVTAGIQIVFVQLSLLACIAPIIIALIIWRTTVVSPGTGLLQRSEN